MAETKILNLASFEDVETLKQTTKSQGEEISQVKSDLSDIDSSIFYEEISTLALAAPGGRLRGLPAALDAAARWL